MKRRGEGERELSLGMEGGEKQEVTENLLRYGANTRKEVRVQHNRKQEERRQKQRYIRQYQEGSS